MHPCLSGPLLNLKDGRVKCVEELKLLADKLRQLVAMRCLPQPSSQEGILVELFRYFRTPEGAQ